MALSVILHSPFLPSQPLLSFGKTRHPQSYIKFTIFAAKKDASGHLVDENMIILRKRIHEIKMVEINYEPPSNWMKWEKRYYTSYDAYVCELVGLLQSRLMNTRPSVALGLMALITLSLPVSTFMIVCNAVKIMSGILH
ncbi:hypothetical protein L1887_30708 [Cichorium endivia]|nr:hypothetical protein L1887_30708 [Cichorium endivia]